MAVYKVTGGDAIICTDVGQHQMWAAQYYKYKRPRQLLTSGGPNYSTSTVMYLLYEIAFKTTKEFGYANAMGVVLAIVIALFSALQFKVMNGGTSE